MTDPIADMLARIRNATIARHARVEMPSSRLKVEIARRLIDRYYEGHSVEEKRRAVEELMKIGGGSG